jgi:4-hydroxy-2-oxoheptanedioate aldolase
VAEIAAVPGVDGIFVGPADLGLSLGHGPADVPPPVDLDTALDTVAEHCRRAGVVAGIAGGAEFVDRGFRILTVAVDRVLLAAGALQEAAGMSIGSANGRG